jgi:hypothetical protein
MSESIPKTAEEFDRRFDDGEDIFSLGLRACVEAESGNDHKTT